MASIIFALILYFAVMLYIGYKSQKRIKSPDDYFTGGSSFGPVLTAIAHQAAGLSGWLFIAWAGQVATMGFAAIWTAFSSGLAPFVNFSLMSAKVSKYTIMTKARSFIDLIEARYYDEEKKYIRIISSIIIFISITVYLSSQLMAAGTTFSIVLGWDYIPSVILSTAVVIAYTSAGGLLAVAWTDFIQGMLMIGAVFIGLIAAFSNIGLVEAFEGLKAIDSNLMNPWIKPITIVGLLSAGLLGYMGQPQIVQMFMGMKDPGKSKKGTWVAGFTGLFLLFGTFFMYLACASLYPNAADSNTNFLNLIMSNTPGIIAGVVTAAILAAVMSSADALLHVATTTMSQDIYNKLIKKGKAGDNEVIKVSRIVSIVIGIGAIYIAFNPFEGILWVNWWAWGGLSTFAPILIFGLYWERATREGAIVGLIGGFLASAIWFALGFYQWLHLTFVAFSFASILLIVVSLLTSEPPQRIRDQIKVLKDNSITSDNI
jgi:sodium/proline symporter